MNLNEDSIIELYNKGFSSIYISKLFNISKATVLRRLKDNNIDRRKRKYILNESFFKKYNLNNSYWAGFIAADGNITKNCLSIELSKIDKEHLKKIKTDICFNGKLYSRNRIKNNKIYKYNSIHIHSKQVVDDLKNNFNIISNKSLIIKPPKIKNKKLICNYIRGYFDGDGSISFDKSFKLTFTCGSFIFLKWVKNNLKKFLKIGNPKIYDKKKNCYVLSFHGNRQVKIIMSWLYKDCNNNFLYRKRKFYNYYMEANNGYLSN